MFASQLVGEQCAEIDTLITRDLRQNRWQFGLRVDCPAFIRGAIEVDGQVGDGCDRCPEIDQLAFDLAVAAECDTPG